MANLLILLYREEGPKELIEKSPNFGKLGRVRVIDDRDVEGENKEKIIDDYFKETIDNEKEEAYNIFIKYINRGRLKKDKLENILEKIKKEKIEKEKMKRKDDLIELVNNLIERL